MQIAFDILRFGKVYSSTEKSREAFVFNLSYTYTVQVHILV